MTTTKVAVTIDTTLLTEIDQLVAQQVFPNRSKAIQAALEDKLARIKSSSSGELLVLSFELFR